MKISPDSTLGEVVKGNFNTAAVFQANNIVFPKAIGLEKQ